MQYHLTFLHCTLSTVLLTLLLVIEWGLLFGRESGSFSLELIAQVRVGVTRKGGNHPFRCSERKNSRSQLFDFATVQVKAREVIRGWCFFRIAMIAHLIIDVDAGIVLAREDD